MKNTIINEKIQEIKSKHTITAGKVDKNIHFKMLSEIVQLRMGKIKEGEVYINNTTKMTFIDKLGREFKMIPNAVKNGHWSPYESGQVRDSEYHMKHLEEIVLSKGGKIKEGEVYVNTNTKMTFIDQLGREFKMKPNALKNGHWSPYESGNVNDPEYHMKKLEEIVLSKGGKIKEGEVYVKAHTKMTFIDQLGNEFKMRPNDIKNGQWSPYEKNYSEHICRQIIEQLYNKEFPSSWGIVKREGKKNLQLDGYNAELNIAFEYQGKQHTTGWRGNEESLIEIQERDKEKKRICIENNILLLEINYYKTTKDLQEMINQTINDVKKSYEVNNKKIPNFVNNLQIGQINIDLSKISHLVLMQKQLEETVSSKEGKIKEGEIYINGSTKMIFIDKLGREFKKTPNEINQGYWSPYESNKVYDPEYHMSEIQKIVSSKEGKIKEGEVYIHGSTKMTFIDKAGNEFKITPNHIKKGSWSPYESGLVRDPEYNMKKIQEIVFSKEGKIKEGEEYVNNKTKMTFIDKSGNEFKMTPSSVKSGHWSPYENRKVFNNIAQNDSIILPIKKHKL